MSNLKMKTFLMTILLLTFFVTAQEKTPIKSNDENYRKAILGKWNLELGKDLEKVSSVFTFSKDGKFHSVAKAVLSGVKYTIKVEGHWRIKDGKLITKVSKSSHPEFVPKEMVTADTIIEINDKTYKYKTQSGQELTQKRTR